MPFKIEIQFVFFLNFNVLIFYCFNVIIFKIIFKKKYYFNIFLNKNTN
jgi:hypothetical protein